MQRRLLFILLLLTSSVFAAPQIKQAIFAGGCFWCVQSDFDKLPGVVSTKVGYDGGTLKSPNYELVSSGKTHYVESVLVKYDAQKVSYKQLVKYFFRHIDPTAKNGQFCDVGEQYRSVVFYRNPRQKKIASKVAQHVKKLLPNMYTEILPSTTFYVGEEYHQDYYKKNPLRYKFYRWNCGRDKRIAEVWGGKTL